MQINITTFAARKKHYLDAMMKSLFASDWQDTSIPINFIMGSEDQSHIQDYVGHPAVRVVPWDEETHQSLRINCTLNKIRALRHGDDETTLICEDDITFSPTWVASLNAATAELANEKYVLSLFAAHHYLAAADFAPGKTLIRLYPTPTMQGAQAMFYPTKAIRDEVATYLTTNLFKGCGDDLIGRYARADAALYSTKNVLVSHIGGVSCFHA